MYYYTFLKYPFQLWAERLGGNFRDACTLFRTALPSLALRITFLVSKPNTLTALSGIRVNPVPTRMLHLESIAALTCDHQVPKFRSFIFPLPYLDIVHKILEWEDILRRRQHSVHYACSQPEEHRLIQRG